MTIDFRFEIDESVKTPFGEIGIITMLGFDDAGNQYHVKTKSTSQWFKERELRIAYRKRKES